jgi:hypothetical protein
MVKLSRQIAPVIVAVIAYLGATACVSAPWEDIRAQEIAQCQQGEIETWLDGIDRPAVAGQMNFVYNHASAPSWFDEVTVLSAVEQSAKAWAACSIPVSVAAVQGAGVVPVGSIVVMWSEHGSRHNFGLANMRDRTISRGHPHFNYFRQGTLLTTHGKRFRWLSRMKWGISLGLWRTFGAVLM